jgi:hypothetical protein
LVSDACSCFVTTPTKTITISHTATETVYLREELQMTTTTTTSVVVSTAVSTSYVPQYFDLVPPGILEDANCGWYLGVEGYLTVLGAYTYSSGGYTTALQSCAQNCVNWYGRM